MKYLFIYLCFITNSLALFQTSCDGSSFKLSEAYVTKESSITCEKLNYFQSTIEDISKFFDDAPFVRLFVSLKSPNASFDYGESISIPLQMTFSNHYGREYYPVSNLSEYILAHEYGHAIFSKLLSKNDFYKEIYQIDKMVSMLEFQKKLQTDFSEADSLKLDELRKKKNSFNKIRRLLNDYSEFYSDVIAVYYANNKEVMVDSLFYFEMSDQQYQLVMARSFSENSIDIEDRIYTEEHASLVLARQFVGEKMWPLTDIEKEIYLKQIYNSLEQEILQRLEKEEFRLNPKDMNERLIDRLRS